LIKLYETKSKLDRKADFRSKALLTLGSTIFMAQFGFIMSGTFVFYSWDVMEPISYIMMLGNFTFGMLFYATYKDELQLVTLRTMLANKFAKGIYRRRGFDIDKLERLEEEIIELREILNKSVN
jgi:Mitochondrial calcium uniporter